MADMWRTLSDDSYRKLHTASVGELRIEIIDEFAAPMVHIEGDGRKTTASLESLGLEYSDGTNKFFNFETGETVTAGEVNDLAVEAFLRKAEDEPENVPCKKCHRKDLPLHTDHLCPNCSPKSSESGDDSDPELEDENPKEKASEYIFRKMREDEKNSKEASKKTANDDKKLDDKSKELTGKNYKELPDDGPEQDHVMHEFEKKKEASLRTAYENPERPRQNLQNPCPGCKSTEVYEDDYGELWCADKRCERHRGHRPSKKDASLKKADKKCPKCGKSAWDVSTVDQKLNKCWDCKNRWMDDPDEPSDDKQASLKKADDMAARRPSRDKAVSQALQSLLNMHQISIMELNPLSDLAESYLAQGLPAQEAAQKAFDEFKAAGTITESI